ncbi:MAG: HNH endonuclease [Anaerolineales bacterium]|nr:HNH endonuclease [Anaerolineales bacterium]
MDSATKEQFMQGLKELDLQGILTEKRRHMLIFQYNAPDRTVTTHDIATEMGYPGYEPANAQYGGLGHELFKAMGFTDRTHERWWPVLSRGRDTDHGFIYIMHDALAEALEELGWVTSTVAHEFPNEIPLEEEEALVEGAKRQVTVNAYERSSEARQQCLDKYGYKCSVCKFDFEQTYGTTGANFIHVHHLIPLAGIGESYEVDPIKDLRPVCPNCHAIIHKRRPPYTIEEVQEMIHKTKSAS